MIEDIGQAVCLFASGFLTRHWLVTAWRRHQWKKQIHTELERNGLEVDKIHWLGDVPAHIHIHPKEGHHDADG